MKRAALLIGLMGIAAGAASATTLAASAAALGATYHAGTRGATSIYGTATQYDGDSGTMLNPTVDYSYSLDGFAVNTAYGDTHDFRWLQDVGTQDPNSGTQFTFGANFSTQFYLDPSIDHDDAGLEALETTLYGSNDGGATWIRGILTDVYELGLDPAAIVDNGASKWSFSQSVNMISAVWGLTQGTYNYNDGDDEIDAVSMAAVPLPTASLMGLAGLTTVGAIRRRRTA